MRDWSITRLLSGWCNQRNGTGVAVGSLRRAVIERPVAELSGAVKGDLHDCALREG